MPDWDIGVTKIQIDQISISSGNQRPAPRPRSALRRSCRCESEFSDAGGKYMNTRILRSLVQAWRASRRQASRAKTTVTIASTATGTASG